MRLVHMYYITIKHFLLGTDWDCAKGFAHLLVYGFKRPKG